MIKNEQSRRVGHYSPRLPHHEAPLNCPPRRRIMQQIQAGDESGSRPWRMSSLPVRAGERAKGDARPAPEPVIEDAPPCGPGSARPRFPDDESTRVVRAPLSYSPPAFLHLPLVIPPRIEGSSLIGLFGISISCLPENSKFATKAMATGPFCHSSQPKRSDRAALPAAPTGCAKASHRSLRFHSPACSMDG